MMETDEKYFLNIVKYTVGYNEATNKTAFLSGANVAITKCMEYYKEQISVLQKALYIRDNEITNTKNNIKDFIYAFNKLKDYLD